MDRPNRWINLSPALIASLIDITLTIVHTPEAYWNGDLTKANEANPIGAFFMANHIAGLFIISAFEVLLIIVLGYYLPRRISKYPLLFVLIAHSCAATTWIAGRYGFWSIMAMALFNSLTYMVANDIIKKRTSLAK